MQCSPGQQEARDHSTKSAKKQPYAIVQTRIQYTTTT